ncbi:uncharacterized protein LOC106083162 [Stomoxys calcitrans]|uniref:uncharacterized protein LOC106083162 n=1 Tax=Stomoxys calcitrans TaxID=35570 RepID=UPI0027E24D9D|nr:uncharacterized protein LOC106083162 [Stomoxys calcitrans]XP_059225564.1 uncharacterized protein LOC106083162 [Stomoxys calcitrans]
MEKQYKQINRDLAEQVREMKSTIEICNKELALLHVKELQTRTKYNKLLNKCCDMAKSHYMAFLEMLDSESPLSSHPINSTRRQVEEETENESNDSNYYTRNENDGNFSTFQGMTNRCFNYQALDDITEDEIETEGLSQSSRIESDGDEVDEDESSLLDNCEAELSLLSCDESSSSENGVNPPIVVPLGNKSVVKRCGGGRLVEWRNTDNNDIQPSCVYSMENAVQSSNILRYITNSHRCMHQEGTLKSQTLSNMTLTRFQVQNSSTPVRLGNKSPAGTDTGNITRPKRCCAPSSLAEKSLKTKLFNETSEKSLIRVHPKKRT